MNFSQLTSINLKGLQDIMLRGGLDIIYALLIMVGAWIIAKLLHRNLIRLLDKRNMDRTISHFAARLLYVLIIVMGLLMALSRIGIPIASAIAILSVAGVAIALSLKNSLSNLAAGIILALTRPFRLGDFIEMGSYSGTVKEIELMFTVVTTSDNKQVTIPNNQLVSNVITNYSRNKTRRNDLIIGIGYDDDIKKALNVIQKVLDQDERVAKEPNAPLLAVNELADSSVNLLIRYWVARADFLQTKLDLQLAIKEALDKAGINIPYPQRDVHMIPVSS